MARSSDSARSEVFFMLLSAGIFAFFGFGGSWAHQYTNASAPQPNVLIPMVAVLKWTLQAGAVAFGIAAVISMVGSMFGPLLYSAVGLVTAVLFAVVAIWDWTNPQGYYSGVPPILLMLFAIWNGFGAWSSLRTMFHSREPAPGPAGL